MKSVLLSAIRCYQAVLSPLLGGHCRFEPSCSRYAARAIEQHGAGRGTVLTFRRLIRCTPFSRGGYDPVPSSGSEAAA